MRYLAASITLAVVVLGAVLLLTAPPPIPSFADVRATWRPSAAQLLDRHGNVLYQMRIEAQERRLEWTLLADISPAIEKAVIASEDRRFFVHRGVDLRALAAAIISRATGRRGRGASTITMQLVTMLDPALGRSGHRSVLQKLIQMRAARALEYRWTKDQILEAYLNLDPWRGEIQGVSAAAHILFGKAPHGVNFGEALVMTALLRAPNARYSAVKGRAEALRRSLVTVRCPPQEMTNAIDSVFAPRHVGFMALQMAPHVAARLLDRNHMLAHSTLDQELQRLATEVLKRHVSEVRQHGVDDGAVLVIENATGQAWAYVGSAGGLSSAAWVDGVRSLRQPGSTLKPFLYAAAIDRRLLTAASLLSDTPLELSEERGIYRPLDYDRQFRGLVSSRTAMGSSLNIPAVRTIQLLGVDIFADVLRTLGLSSIVESGDFYGAALALGSADVSLWDLAGAYRALAIGGTWSPLRLSIDSSPEVPPRRIYSAATAFIVSDILADRASRSMTFGLENSLATRYWSAVKTGTSKDMRDNWCIGYTNRFTVGVWVGNAAGAPMHDVSGITGAAPVWLELMNYLHDRYGSSAMALPPGVSARQVEFPRGIEAPRHEWFLTGTEPDPNPAELDHSSPRIVSPADGSIVALDPDIPVSQQRIRFTSTASESTLGWLLDGDEQCRHTAECMWPPRPGHHTVTLIGPSGHAFDRASFIVKGNAPPQQSSADSGTRDLGD
jgi:penicillin-binding protein 1C